MTSKKRKYLNFGAGLGILGILILFAQSVSPALAATPANTLTVNANQVLRPVTHVASGSLYGLASASAPAASKIAPLKPILFIQKPQGGQQQPTGDISTVASLAVGAGAQLVNRLSDYYPGWPYQFSWSTWTPFITSQINAMKAASYYNSIYAYEIWNEADNTWNTANGSFNDFWVTTYRQIRSLDPNKPIMGPSFSDNISGNSRAPSMQAFLQHARDTNTLPDIISWHELIRASKIEGDVNTVKNAMNSLGISMRPFSIGEYAAPAEVGLPGPLVGYIAKFERLGIHDAELPFWNQSGALGDLLTGQNGSPNAAYWMYVWYANMSGNMVVTTPPSQTGIDGFAAVPSGNNQVSIVVGGCSGDCAVTVNGLNSLNLGSTVTVKIDQTVSQGRTVAVSGPSTISTSTYTPSNGTISVPITMNVNNAYLITITPGGGGGPTFTPTITQAPSQNPIHSYAFDGNANDSGTTPSNGTVTGGTYVTGKIGQAVNLNGSSQYVSFPSGFVSSLSNFSVATWVKLNASGTWSRIFDFGTGTNAYMFLTPQNGSAIRFAITNGGAGSEQQITGSSALSTGVWHHVAITKNGNTGTLYVNGSVVGTNTNMTLSPSSLGNTNQNWIGRSQYSGDPYLNGAVDDFRIYNRALSASEVSSLASSSPTPTPTPGGPTPTRTPTPSATNFLSNADMEGGTTNWVVNGAGTLSSDTTQFHGGTRSVKITGRTASWNGIGQNVAVSNFPTSGQNTTVSVWVRSQTGTPTGIATLRLTASTTTYVQLASAPINSTGWTLLTGTVPVSWSGTLTGVLFYVETAAGTDNIYIDDAQLYR